MVERFDEMEYFILENQAHLGLDNIRRLRRILLFEFILAIFLEALEYALNNRFALSWFYIPPILVTGLFWRLAVYMEKTERIAFRQIRRFAFLCLTVLFGSVAVLELTLRQERESVLFCLTLVLSVTIYMDFFRTVTTYYFVVTLIYLILDGQVKQGVLLIEDIVLVLAAFFASVFCYFMILCIQSDTGRGSRELKRKSNTDLLTGLYNKIAFEEAVRTFLNTRIKGTTCALLIFDFDNFKHVNDRYGHQTGDEVLKYFGFLLHKSFRSNDYVGRVGGDEFMVLMVGAVPGDYIDKRCEGILYQLRDAKIGKAGGFSSSIGIAQDDGTSDFETLYAVADKALYQAKENGKGCYVKYTASCGEPEENGE